MSRHYSDLTLGKRDSDENEEVKREVENEETKREALLGCGG